MEFHYKDHRDGKRKQLSLKTPELIRRLLSHVPEPGVHTVRHYGLYASQSMERRNHCRSILGGIEEVSHTERQNLGDLTRKGLELKCSHCGAVLVARSQLRERVFNENSLIKSQREDWEYYPSTF